ncbi:hypothetical protein RKE30_03210 [Streptomyces sp. Li-HN-5-11]|uniref:imidazolonepropionase-like domain-containing protein n=1 Tax=Streptomyces sp. Li-HN-5-11 TaxID=3075432 RepID=UPI0028A71AD3|nr:hypothetical protein [Streptomyces sp. Li-HN-5-11]WNM29469.1 hypothetical protein RKE30_03210 [Streptomyces sp. Li-HN-5-11]
MLTIHAADEVRCTWDDPKPFEGGAVVVAGTRVEAVGPFDELHERFPDARVRRWPGVLGPARVHEGPLPDAPTPRERVHAVLKLGAVAVLEEHVDSPELRAAAERNGVHVASSAQPVTVGESGLADLAVFDRSGECIATVCSGRLVHRRR